MAETRRNKNTEKPGAQPRASVTFPPELYRTIEGIAKQKKVSIAWVVREAVEKYVADQWPLLAPLRGE
jgi:predicted DNA-binding protein